MSDLEKIKLGRLKSFGITEPWQTAFLLPKGWDDLRIAWSQFSTLPEGKKSLLKGNVHHVSKSFNNNKPRLTGYIQDSQGVDVGFTFFGDTRKIEEALQACVSTAYIFGEVSRFSGRIWLKNPEIIEPTQVGALRPDYPGLARIMRPDTVRERIQEIIPAVVEPAAHWLLTELTAHGNAHCEPDEDMLSMVRRIIYKVGLKEAVPYVGDTAKAIHADTIEALVRLINRAHSPDEAAQGESAHDALEYLAATGIYITSLSNRPVTGLASWNSPVDWKPLADKLPFKLADEQVSAVDELASQVASKTPSRSILVGDVGTGKTAVYALVVAAAFHGAGRSAILMPSQTLAKQVYHDLCSWWPDIAHHIELVIGDRKCTLDPEKAPIVIGTTALLHANTGHRDLVVVDEQHKYSTSQRQQLASSNSHLIEVTATCIPRTQALVKYGVIKVVKLTKCHVEKTIHTRLLQASDRRQLFDDVKASIGRSEQVLVVYPLRSDESKKDDLPSAEAAFEQWNKLFPGRVRLAHGAAAAEDNDQSLRDMKEQKADILVATSVVEVGINIPQLYRVVVVHPERFGLTALHQIRGRAARQGGTGYCDLFLPREVGEDSVNRLRVLEKTSDGFEVAEMDMQIRGFGSLKSGSDKQSGADATFLFGKAVRTEYLDTIIRAMDKKAA